MMLSLHPANIERANRVPYTEATFGDLDAHQQEDACLQAKRNARSRLDLA